MIKTKRENCYVASGTLDELTQQFWLTLDSQQAWLTEPVQAEWGPDVFLIQTAPGFIFDDAFWEIFQQFPFQICHVAYYGPERLLEEDRREDVGIFELRWSMADNTPQEEK